MVRVCFCSCWDNFVFNFDLKLMEDNGADVLSAVEALNIEVDKALLDRFSLVVKDEDGKANRKKLKKNQVDPEDSLEKANEKLNRLLDDLYKNYEAAGKQEGRMKVARTYLEAAEAEREKMAKQKAMFENLHGGFKKKYDEELSKAQQIEKDEEDKRKTLIDQLQERIKDVQGRYEEAGKIKIEKYRENQTLKHQISKYEPHLVASESLADAQLKKKAIQIEIQMTTLKQKIDMMGNFRSMRVETEEKLAKSREVQEKLGSKLKKIEQKEQEHKISLARAHLIFEEYKKAFNVLKETLPKKERDALLAKERVRKSNQSLDDIRKKQVELDREQQNQLKGLEVLQNLEKQLLKQLEEIA